MRYKLLYRELFISRSRNIYIEIEKYLYRDREIFILRSRNIYIESKI